MHKALVLTLLFYSLTANAENKITCLKINQQQNKLTFYYDKQGKEDKPFFYAKVQGDKDSVDKEITWKDVQGMTEHLLLLSDSEPEQYQTPENAKNLYIVKSFSSLDSAKGFGKSARIVPANNKKKKSDNYSRLTKRNAGNFIRVLPEETKKQSSEQIENTVKICKFRL